MWLLTAPIMLYDVGSILRVDKVLDEPIRPRIYVTPSRDANTINGYFVLSPKFDFQRWKAGDRVGVILGNTQTIGGVVFQEISVENATYTRNWIGQPLRSNLKGWIVPTDGDLSVTTEAPNQTTTTDPTKAPTPTPTPDDNLTDLERLMKGLNANSPAPTPDSSQNNTFNYILIGVGVLAVGLVGYLVVSRNRNQNRPRR